LDERINSLSTSRKCLMVKRLTKERDLEGRKIALTYFGPNCPLRVEVEGPDSNAYQK
jgi:hypothetical protein